MSNWFRRHRSLYPDNWPEIAARIKELANWRCEVCGRPGEHHNSLGVDHINSDPAECSDWNLAALCARCHLRRHGLRPRPQTKAEAIERLRIRHEIEIGQLCLPLRAHFRAATVRPGRGRHVRRTRPAEAHQLTLLLEGQAA